LHYINAQKPIDAEANFTFDWPFNLSYKFSQPFFLSNQFVAYSHNSAQVPAANGALYQSYA